MTDDAGAPTPAELRAATDLALEATIRAFEQVTLDLAYAAQIVLTAMDRVPGFTEAMDSELEQFEKRCKSTELLLQTSIPMLNYLKSLSTPR